jgi:hypothetical protein
VSLEPVAGSDRRAGAAHGGAAPGRAGDWRDLCLGLPPREDPSSAPEGSEEGTGRPKVCGGRGLFPHAQPQLPSYQLSVYGVAPLQSLEERFFARFRKTGARREVFFFFLPRPVIPAPIMAPSVLTSFASCGVAPSSASLLRIPYQSHPSRSTSCGDGARRPSPSFSHGDGFPRCSFHPS